MNGSAKTFMVVAACGYFASWTVLKVGGMFILGKHN
jgi:hypothetical protein